MVSHRDVEAWIEIDGARAEEFEPETSADGKVVTCWICSEEEKTFSVSWKTRRRADVDLVGDVHVDGRFAQGKYTNRISSRKRSLESTVVVRGKRVSLDHEQPFVFSKVQLTEDPTDVVSSVQDLGTIKLRMSTCEKSHRISSPVRTMSDTGATRLYERTKKTITHAVSYGENLQPIKRRNTRNCTYIDKNFVVFIFRYRSKGFLQASNIIPEARSSTAAITIDSDEEGKSDVDEAKVFELEKQAKRAREELDAKRSRKRVKTEPQADKMRVKKERGPDSTTSSPVVIDLT